MSPQYRLVTNNAIRAIANAALAHDYETAVDVMRREAAYARGLVDGLHVGEAIDNTEHRRLLDRIDAQLLASIRNAGARWASVLPAARTAA